ncbi:MAG: CBS domain-containing protein [Nitrospinales bacterium]|jgi:CBS domain-containing protein
MDNKKVCDVMSATVVSINPKANINDAINLINANKVGSLFVKEGEEFIGILTKTDLLKKVILKNLDYDTTKIHTIMSEFIVTIDSEANLKEALELMTKNQIRYLGVIVNSEIVGILSIKDVSDYFTGNM